uniref:Uncharacterized protein n=1 Tax=Romanomermis culicivorax TaxID=13658 RepID=A0A915IRU4_ROMCU
MYAKLGQEFLDNAKKFVEAPRFFFSIHLEQIRQQISCSIIEYKFPSVQYSMINALPLRNESSDWFSSRAMDNCEKKNLQSGLPWPMRLSPTGYYCPMPKSTWPARQKNNAQYS